MFFLKPLRTKSAKEVAFRIGECVLQIFGVPQILQSDNEQVMVADVPGGIEEIGGVSVEENYEIFSKTKWGWWRGLFKRQKQVFVEVGQRGIFSGWEYYIPAIQMGLNDRIISRHRSRPVFSDVWEEDE